MILNAMHAYLNILLSIQNERQKIQPELASLDIKVSFPQGVFYHHPY